MALKSTIFKANLQIADIDHHYYADHALTLARHPSETDLRLMIRLVALAYHAYQLQEACRGDGQWSFGEGLASPDEPDVWLRDWIGQNQMWIEVGQPEERPIAKACGRSQQVLVYAFNHASEIWWQGIQKKLIRFNNLAVWQIPATQANALIPLVNRSMQLCATVQEGVLTLSDHANSVEINRVLWQ